MKWNMMDLAVKHLNVTALKEWKNTVLTMDTWMQAVMVGALVFLIGAAFLSWLWGLKMTKSARFAAGITSVFHITMILLVMEYSMDLTKALIIAGIAGAAAGFLYAFLERIFQFAAGFVFGDVLATWLLPKYFHLKLDAQAGRIWRLVAAIAVGVLFALLAKKLRFLLTAFEGGVVLGLLGEMFFDVTKIPWISEKLTEAQILNLFPIVVAAVGIVIQFFQWIGMIREQRALQIPSGEERDGVSGQDSDSEQSGSENSNEGDNTSEQEQDADAITMVEAEEVLVEKAKELALAANRSAQNARMKERYEDVAEGLYGPDVAAHRLGISEEEFLGGMKKSGYQLPSGQGSTAGNGAAESGAAQGSTAEGAAAQSSTAEDASAEDTASAEAAVSENTATEDTAPEAAASGNTASESAAMESAASENTALEDTGKSVDTDQKPDTETASDKTAD